MIAALIVLVFGHSIVFTPEPVDRHQIAARYASQCGGAAAATKDCKQLQWQLEQQLYDDLRAGGAANHDTWRIAAAADVPLLAVLGLRNLGNEYAKADDAIVASQVDSPFTMVRAAAWDLVDRTGLDKIKKLAARRESRHALDFPIEDEIPDATRLGAPVYPGASYRYFASNDRRAFFTTDDSPDKVAAFYAKGPRKPMTLVELKAEQKKRAEAMQQMQKDPMAMSRKMQAAMKAGQDPQKVAMAMAAQMGGADKDWSGGLAGEEGVVAPRFLPLDDTLTRMGYIFRDELLGQTAIVFQDIPTTEELVLMQLATSGKPADVQRMQEHMKVLQQAAADGN